jgi:L-histidine N-alpha-methyltransferase
VHDRSEAALAIESEREATLQSMRSDVRRGLSLEQKELDPKYFYDERGSELFEEITNLAEYYPTRAERALLLDVMPALIDELQPASLIELGAGSSSKTRVILDAMSETGPGRQYVPVDVSSAFLQESAAKLRVEYPDIHMDPAVGDFAKELDLPPLQHPALFAFLGSTIGNFREGDAVQILSHIALRMRGDDAFILGVDLRKDPRVIEAAYNDAAGVTAEFNINILRVLNRELLADFDLSAFTHRAFYDQERNRIEMHLDSAADQTVNIPELGTFEIRKGESIRTELSYKYDRATVTALFEKAGLCLERWMTGDDGAFGLAVGSRRWGVR